LKAVGQRVGALMVEGVSAPARQASICGGAGVGV